MASRWWSASMLLASLMSLYWMTSAAQPHTPLTAELSQPYRVQRDLPVDTRENVQASTQVVKDTLAVVTEIFKLEEVEKASEIIKSFSKCAGLVPGIGGLVSSVISVVLAFIPQEDPVLTAVKEGFAEVNRKLDSLSIQIADLATDVEWFNYISIYSQDERHILNAWRRFSEFPKASELLQSEKDKQRLAQTFISYYENTGAETGLINLYHYLTVTQTSLTVNINELLRRKLKCHVGQIGKYNLYLNSLLWKGMVVNQFYWKLMGFNTALEEAKHIQMFKKVTEAQISTIEFCLNSYEDYMKKDVIEITKGLSPDDKGNIAAQVKKRLDQKYNWYSWVVLVYDRRNDENIDCHHMTKIPVDDIIVAVDYTLGGERAEERGYIESLARKCFRGKECKSLGTLPECTACFAIEYSNDCRSMNFTDFAKLVYVEYNENNKVEPKPFYYVFCHRDGNAAIYFSMKLSVCTDNTCKNGNCVRLLNSNESWCKCHDGYYGDTCENKMMF